MRYVVLTVAAVLVAAAAYGQLIVRDEGVRLTPPQVSATTVNCSGSGVTCTYGNGTWTLAVSGGASGAPDNAQYWVGAADGTLSAEKNLGALATGLVINTAGVPSAYTAQTCAAGNYVSATSASGALTCAIPQGVPGGNNTEVQYNNNGAFGGIASVETNGTHLSKVGVTSLVSAPASDSLEYNLRFASSWPPMPFYSPSVGTAIPQGLFNFFTTYGSDVNWDVRCARILQHGTSTVGLYNMPAFSETGTPANVNWAATSLLERQKRRRYTSGTALNTSAGWKLGATIQETWRGDSAGEGGFLWWMRANISDTKATARFATGLFTTTSALTASADPNAALDSVYFGCNSGDSNLSICSNDNSSTATCNTLGASFPCTTDGAFYDFWLYAAPNASTVEYRIERLDSAASAVGTVSSDLPQNTVQLNTHLWINTAGTNNTAVAVEFMNYCLASNL